MDWLRSFFSRVAALFGRQRRDHDLDEELAAHLELLTHEYVAKGMSHADAHTAALRDFGGVTQTRETYRIQRGFPRIEQIGRDLRYAMRQLRKSPGFALTAIFTLALGIGANTAVFSLLDSILLRPLPVPHADDLAVIRIDRSDDKTSGPNYGFNAPFVRALEQKHDIFESLTGYSLRKFQVRTSSGTVDIPGCLGSGQFFQVLDTPPLLGRWLTAQDDREGKATEAVISEGFWKTHFNRDPDVVGQTLTIAGQHFTIVGVMPAGFIGADSTFLPEIYLPMWAEPIVDAPYSSIASGYHSWWLRVLARRAPGVSLERANAALAAASNAILAQSIPDASWIKDARDHHFRFTAEPGARGYTYLRAMFRKPLIVVFVLCTAMLLLACMNLASLSMARAAVRERELATRLAMGASRLRLIQQLLIESLLIALLGTLAGLLGAPLVSRSLAAILTGTHNQATLNTSLDLRVLFFVAFTAVISTVVIGLVPALRATSTSLNEQIKSGSHSVPSRQRRLLPQTLMGLQVALALILVFGAGLLATSLDRLYNVPLGFDPKGVVDLTLAMNQQSRDGEAAMAWYREYADALRHLPGVRGVSYADLTPMGGSTITYDFSTPSNHGDQTIYMNMVSPGFFETMHIPLFAGRDFKWNDTRQSGLKIVLTRSAVKVLFPGQNPLGQNVFDGKTAYQVVGVVGDIHYASLFKDAPAGGYLPMTQSEMHHPGYLAVVRVDGSPAPLAAAARRIAAKMAPEIPAPAMTSISGDIDNSIASERMMAMLAVFFAICALLVTGIGLYGTLAYSTARRTSEIGVRMALGAQRTRVVGLIFRENAWVALCGSVVGLVVAWFAARALASFLYSTSARDPWVLFASFFVLVSIASAASIVPAVRAARIEPSTALRTE